MNKNKSKTSEAAIESRKVYQEDLDKLFEIGVKDLLNSIDKDRLRTNKNKEEDKKFYNDQKDPKKRKMQLGKFDGKYECKVQKKLKRDATKRNDIESEPEAGPSGLMYKSDKNSTAMIQSKEQDLEVNISTESIDSNGNDEDFQDKNSSKPSKITLEVPRNIMKLTAMTYARYKNSARNQIMNLADLINKSGGNVKDFILSYSTANRCRKVEVTKRAESVKSELKEKVNEIGRKFVIHFDGKSVLEYTEGTKVVKERIAVILTSPELEHDKVLGVPAVAGGKGEEIVDGIVELLSQWGIDGSHIMGCVLTLRQAIQDGSKEHVFNWSRN